MELAAALAARLRAGASDTWMKPLVAASGGRAVRRIRAGDTVIFACRRGEREVQLASAFVEPGFARFRRVELPGLAFAPLVEYDERLAVEPIVAPLRPERTLPEELSRAGLRQLLVSETEKRAHVTTYFNGRRGRLFPGQEAVILESPTDPESHPGMCSAETGEAVVAGLGTHDFVLANFCACDVVGHSADFGAKVKAVAAVDRALARIVAAARAARATILVTADHGLIEEAGGARGASHTTNPVPFLVAGERLAPRDLARREGTLADVAPTVLGLFGLPVPPEMTGRSLLAAGVRSAKVAVIVLDGWGIGTDDPARNPIAAAAPAAIAALEASMPRVTLQASGSAVGLPEGRGGNSEAGHLTVGAGRVVEQDELRVTREIAAGFAGNERLAGLLRLTVERGAGLHLIGLLSETSSHGTIEEVLGLARIARGAGVADVTLHLILDGHGASAVDLLATHSRELESFAVATAVGRGYALDRSGDYARTEVAYRALVLGEGEPFDLPRP